jgi:type IX secretion system PorP/SprF family membrane protein
LTSYVRGQETIPVYSDYLSDNIYLVHPAAAGIGDCGKLRLTAQQQWFGIEDAPGFQTLSYNGQIGEKAGMGFILYNDQNGYHSKKGVQATYAYHLNMGGWRFNQMSFGFSFNATEDGFDTRDFFGDPNTSFGNEALLQGGYVSADIGMAYYYDAFYFYATAKNLFVTDINRQDILYEDQNLRNYLVNLGYYVDSNRFFQWEPSVMVKYFERNQEVYMDLNTKFYKPLDRSLVWAALSYRHGFNTDQLAPLDYVSAIAGVNVGRMMVSYTYTQQLGDVVVEQQGFHQISIGFNLFCKKTRASACPNPNLKMPFYY